MKLKEWFSQLKTQGKISHEEFDKFVESVPDAEIPDAAVKAFDDKFLTLDRAAAHPDVTKKLKFETLNPLSRDLEKQLEVIKSIDKDVAAQISRLTKSVGDGREIPDTYKQSEAITAALKGLFDKVRVAPTDDDAKKKYEEQKKVIDELTEKFSTAKSDYDKNLKTALEAKDKEMTDYKMDAYLQKLVSSYTFADAFKDTRPTLTKALLGELKASNTLQYATKENNEESIDVVEIKDGITSPKFNGNNPVTIQSLLDEKFKSFLKTNGVETQQQQTSPRQFRVETQQNPKTRTGHSTEVKV